MLSSNDTTEVLFIEKTPRLLVALIWMIVGEDRKYLRWLKYNFTGTIGEHFYHTGAYCDLVLNPAVLSQDPKVRPGSVDIMRHWYALGYLLIYISARPDMQHRQVASWLAQHNFPPGLTFFLDGIFADPLRQKALLLKSLVEQVCSSSSFLWWSREDMLIRFSLTLIPFHESERTLEATLDFI